MKLWNTTRSFIASVILATVSTVSSPASAQGECLIGEVKFFAGNFAPRGWAKADGRLLSISQNESLFSIVGTMYGGNGRSTFGLPDLRGRTVVGEGDGPALSRRNLGAKIGIEKFSLPGRPGAIGDSKFTVVSGNTAVDLQPPALVLTPIICMVGSYPSRN